MPSCIVQFNPRIAPPGTSFFYASIEADVVDIVVHCAVSHSLSDYFREDLWEPISNGSRRLVTTLAQNGDGL